MLSRLTMPVLVVAVSSDILYPPSEQKRLFQGLPKAEFFMIESQNGHDGFLLDHAKMTPVALDFLSRRIRIGADKAPAWASKL